VDEDGHEMKKKKINAISCKYSTLIVCSELLTPVGMKNYISGT
jgi:hypothetical protein